jgi:CDP-paratose synthetase
MSSGSAPRVDPHGVLGQDRPGEAYPRLLLTGATGFLGNHLLRALLDRGNEVVILKRSTSNTGRIADLLGRVQAVDVDRRPLSDAFANPVDIVVHLATSFGRAGEAPNEVIASNVVFPMQLLETLVKCGGRAFVNTDTFLARSDCPPEGLEYYVHTKACFRECAFHYALRHGLRYTDLQLEHVFGPQDGPTKFVPALVKALLRDKPVFPLTGGQQVRDFIHVFDVVEAYLTIIDHALADDVPRTIEVGTGIAITLREFVEQAREVACSRTVLNFGALPYRTGELMRSVADPTYLRTLRWTPNWGIRDGLRHVIEVARSSASTPTSNLAGERQ